MSIGIFRLDFIPSGWVNLIRSVCRQRVYGVTTATVKVGYEYSTCPDVLWEVQTTKLSGHDMSISDIGGWNLDIHHRYNFHEGSKYFRINNLMEDSNLSFLKSRYSSKGRRKQHVSALQTGSVAYHHG